MHSGRDTSEPCLVTKLHYARAGLRSSLAGRKSLRKKRRKRRTERELCAQAAVSVYFYDKMCSSGMAPKGSLKEAGKLFLKHTTFHGLRHIFLSGSYPRRLAWLLAFLTALALLFTWSSNRVRYLLSSPVYTKAHMVYAKRLVFPAVTICNQNLLLPRRMKKLDIFSAGRWLGLLGKNWQLSPAVRDILASQGDIGGSSSTGGNEPPWSPLSRILDFNHFLPPPQESQPSMRQLLDRLGHQLEEMLLHCSFQGETCGPRNFSTVSLWTAPQ